MTEPTNSSPADSTPTKDTRKKPSVSGDLERERLEPGLDAGGTGGAGATPGRRQGHDNSNT